MRRAGAGRPDRERLLLLVLLVQMENSLCQAPTVPALVELHQIRGFSVYLVVSERGHGTECHEPGSRCEHTPHRGEEAAGPALTPSVQVQTGLEGAGSPCQGLCGPAAGS